MSATSLAAIEVVARQILDGHRRRARLLARQEALLYSEGSAGVAAALDDLRAQLHETENRLLQACARLRALGTRIVFSDPLTIAVLNLPQEETRFVWLDGAIAHIALVPEARPPVEHGS